MTFENSGIALWVYAGKQNGGSSPVNHRRPCCLVEHAATWSDSFLPPDNIEAVGWKHD